MAKIRTAGAAVLFNGERIMLARRNPKSRFFGDFFSFVGGSLEESESPVEATRREVEEELGIQISTELAGESLGILTTPPFSPIRFATHFFAFPWIDEAAPTPITDELVEVRWDTAENWLTSWIAGEVKIPPPVLHVLRLAREIEPGPDLWKRCRDEGLWLEGGNKLHQIYFCPGLLMAPLETPTIPPAAHTNCYILGLKSGIVVDPAPESESEQAKLDTLIKEVGFTPTAAVLTHHHPDHAAGALAFAKRWNIPLRAHPITADLVEGAIGDIEPGDSLETDQQSWKVLFTPGHAPGHICLQGEESGDIVCGDMISTLSTIVIDPPEGHMATYLESLAALKEAEPRALFPSHGPPAWRPVKKLQATIEHRHQREAKVSAALSESFQSVRELVPAIYDDVPEKFWPLAERSTLAHLIHLEEQGQAARDETGAWRRG